MVNTVTLAKWEWFKLKRSRMPWVLLGILILFTQLAVWGGYNSYNSIVNSGGQAFLAMEPGAASAGMPSILTINCNELESNPMVAGFDDNRMSALLTQCQQIKLSMEQLYSRLTPAGSIVTALGTTSTIGLILIGILTASIMGSDYRLGTLRPILVRGTGRLPYIMSKLVLLLTTTTAALLAVGIAAVVSGFIIAEMVVLPEKPMTDESAWIEAGLVLCKTWLALIPYISLAVAVTVLTRSTAAGMAISLGYSVAERILSTLLSALFNWFDTVAEFLLMSNINAVMGSAGILSGIGSGNEIDSFQASIVLAIYTLVFIGITVWVFLQRDICGANSE